MTQAIADQLFLSYMGRAADTQWRSNTTTLITAQGGNPTKALKDAFFTAGVAEGVYAATDSASTLVNKFFLNTFGFAARTDEQTFWGNLLANGTYSAGELVWQMFSSYANNTTVLPATYVVPMQSKLMALAAYSNALTDPTINASYSQINSTASAAGRTYLSAVTSQATAATAITGVAATVAAVSVANGQSFTLTTNIDTSGVLVGSALTTNSTANDTYTATIVTPNVNTGTFNSSDALVDVGGTNDILNITVSGANGTGGAADVALVSGIETINVRAVMTTAGDVITLSAGNFAGATSVNADRAFSVVTVTNLAAGATAGMVGNGTVVNGAFNAGWVAAATAHSLNISGGTTAGAVVLTGTGGLTTTINSTGAANTVGAVTAAITSTTLAINATTALTTGALTAAGVVGTTFTISGAGAVTTNVNAVVATALTISNSAAVATGVLNNATVTVNASTATGAVTTTLGTSTVMAFTGGSGNDIVTAGAILGATAAVNAGAGTSDRIVFTNANQLTTVSGARYTNFEVVQSTGATGLDMDLIAGITALRTSGNATFTNVSAAQAAAITTIASGNLDIGVKNSTNVGQLDTVSITASATNTAVAIGTLAAAGVETINLTGATGTGLTSITTLAHDAWSTLNLLGSSAITVTTTATAALVNTAINASTATGIITVDATLSTTLGLAITGGTNNDILTGSALADIIVGGTGNDTLSGLAANDNISGGDGTDSITGGAGADTVTGGAGVDTFIFDGTAGNASNGADGGAVAEIIIDFLVGTDKLQFTNVTDIVSVQQAAVQTAVTALAAGSTNAQIATAMALANTTSLAVSFAVFNGNTYVYYETAGGTGTHVAANNTFIQLTGLTTAPTFAADVIA